jgi:uncharacterized repeat protein (TIGR03803 family)
MPMPSTRRSPIPTVRLASHWLAVLLVSAPVITLAQTTPAVSTIVAFSSSQPNAAPVRGPDGALYGTTSVASSTTGGLIYRAEVDGTAIVTLHQLTINEGYSPVGGLTLGSDRQLYGTTSIGALTEANTAGTVFRIQPDGTGFTILYRFQTYSAANQAGTAVNADGANPETELVEGNDGFLYGITRAGGANGTGVIFKVSKEGTGFAVLHTFGPITSAVNATPVINEDGIGSTSPLIAGADNYFYGTAANGGPSGNGTVFRVRFDGTGFEVLHAFTAIVESDSSTLPTNEDGATPIAGLTDGQDGRLYGVTNLGGEFGNGTLYAIDPVSRVFSVLHDFDGFKGARPTGELLLAQDGKLYGTTATGGTNAGGTVTTAGTLYSIARDGTGFTSLLSLDGADGSTPTGRLLQLNDTTFVGVAQGGGRCSQGTLFQFSLTGAEVDGITNCGQRRNSGSGSMAPGLLLLLGALGLARRTRRA